MTQNNSIKNVPNMISLFRFICVPIMVAMFLIPINNGVGIFVALAIYIIGSISDAVDGYIARKYNLITNFGKFIDQIADKFLQTAGLVLVLFLGDITPSWLCAIILLIIILRDIEISGVRMIAASRNTVIPADMIGKIKSNFIDVGTTVLMFYIGLVHSSQVGESGTLWFIPYNYIEVFGLAVLVTGTVLSVISCINYTIKAWPLIVSEETPKSTKKVSSKKTDNSALKDNEEADDIKLYTASGKESVSKLRQYKNSAKIYSSSKKIKK